MENNNCLFNELLKFDPNKDVSDTKSQILAAIGILLFSNMSFIVLMKVFAKDLLNKSENDEKEELKEYKEKEISPTNLYLSDCLNSVLYAPIVEELVFRFFIFKTILYRKFNMNIHSANILQAFIFGGFHITNSTFGEQRLSTTIVQVIAATISGIINGYSYIYTNSILPSILAHILNNLLATHSNYVSYKDYLENK